MSLTAELAADRRDHVESRLRGDPIAWLTTVRPSGRPDTVPVWFLVRDDTIVVYSRPNTPKMRNLTANPQVSVVLDGTSDGHDVVRVEGSAAYVEDYPPAYAIAEFTAKYATLLDTAGFGTVERFAEQFSAAIVVTPAKVRT